MGAQNRPREGRREEQTRLRRRYEPQKVSREPQEEPKMVSWLPRSSQETPKSIPEEPKSLRRGSQEHPKGAQESPKTLSEPWSDQKRRFFIIRRMSLLKSMILRVILGAQNRPQEGRRGERTRLRRIYEPKKVSRELQEKPKRAPQTRSKPPSDPKRRLVQAC